MPIEKVGDTITHIIPIRSFVDCKEHWLQLYDNIRSGKEDIVSAIATDVDTLKIVTKRIK